MATLSTVCFLAAASGCASPPVLNSIIPAQGPPGATLALAGSEFASGMTVQFGATPAATVNVSSANAASTAVPIGLGPGIVNVTVTVGGRQSNSQPFAVMAATSAPRFWRASASDIQAFRYAAPPAALTLAQTHGAGLSPGGMSGTVGLVRTRDALLRATSTGIDVCTHDNVGLIVGCTAAAAGLSGVASDIAMFGTLVARGTNSGLELFTYDRANKTLTPTATIAGSAANASTGVAVAFVADGFPPTAPLLVVRATDRGIDVFNVSNPASPTLTGSHNTAGVSTTGVDVAMLSPTRVVRAQSSGIDVFTVSASAPPALVGSRAAAPSASRVSIDADSSGLAVRSHAGGVEVFDLSGTTVPAPRARTAASSGADLSATGTSITLIGWDPMGGPRAARVTDDSVEVWDVSGTDPLPPPTRLGPSNQVTLSPTGTAVAR
jgi:hypothetical protein